MNIAIRTAPRKISYLQSTIHSIKQVFPDGNLHLFAEPGSPTVQGAVVHQNEKRLGVYANFLRALSYLVENTPGPWFVICEDDISLLPLFGVSIDKVLSEPVPSDFGFYNPYCAKPRGKEDFFGWYNPADISLYGALCLIFHETTVRDLLAIYKTERAPDKGADSCIGILTDRAGLRIYQHSPTLVDHIGFESTIVDTSTLPQRLLQNRKPFYGRNFNNSTG